MTANVKGNGKASRLFWNIIASGLSVDYDLDTLRRFVLVNASIIVGIFFLVLLGLFAFFQDNSVLCIVDLMTALVFAYLIIYLRKTRKINIVGIVGSVVAGILFFFLVTYGGLGNSTHVWAFTYPLITLFLLGKRLGTGMSFSLLVMCCAGFALAPKFDFIAQYNSSLMIRFVAAYTTVHMLGLIMEMTREKIQHRLMTSRLELEIALEKIQKSTDELGESNQQLQAEILERKRVEKALRSSESFLEDIIESIQDGICVLDQNLTVQHTNSVMRHWYPDDLPLVGKKCYQCFYNRNHPCEPCPGLKCLQSGKTEREIISASPDSSIESLEVYSFPIKDNETGEITGFVEFLRDITERERLESRLAHAQKMEAVGTLAGGVAHDLNNILSGIVSYPDLLLMKLPEDNPMRKTILTVQKSGQKAAAIVQDLLTLARRGVPIHEVVHLGDAISSFLNSPECKKIVEYHPKVHIECDIQPDVLNVIGSPIHLSKTIMNLVSNAAEAMPDGGKIYLTVFNRFLNKQIDGYEEIPAGDYVVLTVADSGHGIAPEDLNRIFEPFYTKKKMGRSGTGLGMAVVWGTVKDLNGFIDVHSIFGKGTKFSLYLPATLQEYSGKDETIPIADYSGNEKILVVDDGEEQREIASAMLSTIGYSVTVVASGEDAIEYLKMNRADIVILDMMMEPGMDGLMTYTEIIKADPHQKVIIASGYSETDRVKEAQRLGAGAYIKKPYSLEEIGLAIRKELDRP
ncbi:MAG: response regulator [Desulfobacteraceae bacterium]|jgi:signal transduction histidine kinase